MANLNTRKKSRKYNPALFVKDETLRTLKKTPKSLNYYSVVSFVKLTLMK